MTYARRFTELTAARNFEASKIVSGLNVRLFKDDKSHIVCWSTAFINPRRVTYA